MKKPMVALVGRPNVGKSTLFNRLAGQRLAVVDDVPGTTRDRLLAESEWTGHIFDIMDTGGIDPTHAPADSRHQPLSVGSAPFVEQIREQAQIAIQESDAVLFLVDGQSGVTAADKEVANLLRRLQTQHEGQPWPPIFLVVNKCDNRELMQAVYDFYELGLGTPYPISSLHGIGLGDLLDAVVATFPEVGESLDDASVKIALVGKPNAGKSTLLNRLLGQERAIVSDIPGTTRDAVDTYLTYEDIPITLIDTAGIRRRGKITPGVEKYSVMRSLNAIKRADVALLLIDAATGITAQDTHIAGYIQDAWKSALIVVNKWDAIPKDTYTMQTYTQKIRYELRFIDYAPLLFISAKTGQRVDQVLPTALRVHEERLVRLPTSKINTVLRDAMQRHPPPSKAGRQLKIYYGTQVRTDPPTILVYVNDPKLMHFSYVRFLENRFRETYGFLGTPIRIVLRPRR